MYPKIELIREINAAIEAGDINEVERLLDSDSEALSLDTPFGSWLHVAAFEGHLDIVKMLISRGLSVNINAGPTNNKPIDEAVIEGNEDVVVCLLDNGSEMDTHDSKVNPLFGAIIQGETSIAKLLVDRGIDVSVRYTSETMNNMGAIDLAKEYGRSDIVKILEDHDRRQKN